MQYTYAQNIHKIYIHIQKNTQNTHMFIPISNVSYVSNMFYIYCAIHICYQENQYPKYTHVYIHIKCCLMYLTCFNLYLLCNAHMLSGKEDGLSQGLATNFRHELLPILCMYMCYQEKKTDLAKGEREKYFADDDMSLDEMVSLFCAVLQNNISFLVPKKFR